MKVRQLHTDIIQWKKEYILLEKKTYEQHHTFPHT